MSEVFRFYGFSFFFYSREHEPAHIHVEGAEGYATFDFVDDQIVVRETVNLKSNDMKRIKRVVELNKEIILEEWHNYFGKEKNNED